jgi:rubredoxin
MARKKIKIPEGVSCPDCGSKELIGRGTDWRNNPDGDNPPRIKIQLLRCKNCGLIFPDGKVEENGGK